ncbi:DUF3558 family protein [Tomitella gaofuii]|uniref:DUF3558 family protein n=1 Tax=Tomitella gaofuii TaxID=2760083 RepID=UPI0015FA9FED
MKHSSVTAVCCLLIAVAGCASSPARSNSTAPISTSSAAGSLTYEDPCTPQMAAWFTARELPPAAHIPVDRDSASSGCTYSNHEFGASVMSQLEHPDGSTARWVQRVLEASGEVLPLEVAGRPAKMSIRDHDGPRQDCHVLVVVDFGFVHVIGGPRGDADVSPARDCDQTRTLATALVTRLMDH